MKLKEFIVSDENIYWAIYSLKSYVFNVELLSQKDKQLFQELKDPFSDKRKVILDIRTRLKKIIKVDDFFFDVNVYFEPKKYGTEEKHEYRPLHTSDLINLIAMVALLHPIVYEIPCEDNNYRIELSSYSRLLPSNFYGNRVSTSPESLFHSWNSQYSKFTEKTNEYLTTFNKTEEYMYERKLDFKGFFPSVNPLYVYGMLLCHRPNSFDEEDVKVLKKVITKLLVCKVKNLESARAKAEYYGDEECQGGFTRGLPQGLPQAYFFGNVCMAAIAKKIETTYKGKFAYYVDDVYMYVNDNEIQDIDFNSCFDKYIKRCGSDFILNDKIDNCYYNISLNREKCKCEPISEIVKRNMDFNMLSREVSKIGSQIRFTYSEEEDNALLARTEAMLEYIDAKRKNGIDEISEEKLVKYYKYFKYRAFVLKIRLGQAYIEDILEVLIGGEHKDPLFEIKDITINKSKLNSEDFFDVYKHNVWKVAIGLLFDEFFDEDVYRYVKEYLLYVEKQAYGRGFEYCSYLRRAYIDMLGSNYEAYLRNEVHSVDRYGSLKLRCRERLGRYSKVNKINLREKFTGTVFEDIKEKMFLFSGMYSKTLTDHSIIVRNNSDRMERMFLNAVYSTLFKVDISDAIVISSYDRTGISYGELRLLAYLRNYNFVLEDFWGWRLDISSLENGHTIDYGILEVLDVFRKYVQDGKRIDDLICVHKYTADMWKNGSKHMYFYTLHNQEHAVELIKNIVKVNKVIDYIQISKYDFYVVFAACYLHDISMVKVASSSDFINNYDGADVIVSEAKELFAKATKPMDYKRGTLKIYEKIDAFYEEMVRGSHADDSAAYIRRTRDLEFLDDIARECVAYISEGHGMAAEDVYCVKSNARDELISYKFDRILLRLADLLDMNEHRVSKPLFMNNIYNMSATSAFHWISHMMTESYELKVRYDYKKDVSPSMLGKPNAVVELKVYTNMDQCTAMEGQGCDCCCMADGNGESISRGAGFSLRLVGDECRDKRKCDFMCRWFNKKNGFLVDEFRELGEYLNRVPAEDKMFDKVDVVIRVVAKSRESYPAEIFDILQEEI